MAFHTHHWGTWVATTASLEGAIVVGLLYGCLSAVLDDDGDTLLHVFKPGDISRERIDYFVDYAHATKARHMANGGETIDPGARVVPLFKVQPPAQEE
jgi:hypothetical protein